MRWNGVVSFVKAINNSQGNVRYLVIHKGTTFPASPAPAEGQLFYKTDENLGYIYDGANWQPLWDGAPASEIDNDSAVAGASVKDALDTLNASIGTSGDKISDADADTTIEVEKNPDEDIIRFTVASTEIAQFNDTGIAGLLFKYTNPTNMVLNGNLEDWSAGTSNAPDSFTFATSGSGTVGRDTDVKVGVYSARLNNTPANDASLEQTFWTIADNGGYLRGQDVTISCWVKTSSTGAYIQLIDDNGSTVETTQSVTHSGGGTWELITVTRTIRADADLVTVKLINSTTHTGNAYYDGVMAVQGSCPFAFVANPADIALDTTSINPNNLVKNGDFSLMSEDDAAYWYNLNDIGIITRETNAGKLNANVIGFERGASDSELTQILDVDVKRLINQNVTFSMWVNGTGSGISARVFIDDGITRSFSSFHTASGTYEKLTVTKTIDGSATEVIVGIILDNPFVGILDAAIANIGKKNFYFDTSKNEIHPTGRRLFVKASASTTWVIDSPNQTTQALDMTQILATVYDSTDDIIIPSKMTATAMDELTLTFSVSESGKICIIGKNVPADHMFFETGGSAAWVVNHNLDSQNLVIIVYDDAKAYDVFGNLVDGEVIQPDSINFNSSDQITLNFAGGQNGFVKIWKV